MVNLEEIEDESFAQVQTGPGFDDGDYTDTDSEISDDEDLETGEESFTDRIYALKDIVPPTTRGTISSFFNTTTNYVKGGLGFSGKALYVLTTSALLLGVPWALAFAEEQQMVEMEKEMRMREMGGELLGGGGAGPEAKPAL